VGKLDFFFHPRNIAVIGATPKEGKLGRVVFETLTNKFKGKVYPVNPNYEEVLGYKSYPSVKELPESLDLAIIIVPAPIVPSVVKECS